MFLGCLAEDVTGQRTDGILAAVDAKRGAEAPVDSFFDWVVENVWKERDDGETEL